MEKIIDNVNKRIEVILICNYLGFKYEPIIGNDESYL